MWYMEEMHGGDEQGIRCHPRRWRELSRGAACRGTGDHAPLPQLEAAAALHSVCFCVYAISKYNFKFKGQVLVKVVPNKIYAMYFMK